MSNKALEFISYIRSKNGNDKYFYCMCGYTNTIEYQQYIKKVDLSNYYEFITKLINGYLYKDPLLLQLEKIKNKNNLYIYVENHWLINIFIDFGTDENVNYIENVIKNRIDEIENI